MSIIVKRATKGSGLTSGEIDANVNNLNNDKVEINNSTFKAAPSLVNNLIPLTGTVLPTINPSLNLDFANGKQLDPRITFSRNTVATYINKYGLLVSAASNVPRFDYDPVTKKCLGLLIEELRTNSLLNSTIDGVNLATQSITTTAVARTLSFYGTGTIVLSGTATATITGLGAYPTRTTYTYMPTAGTLTLTVSGTVQYANDEVGAFATSYMPTAGTEKSRAADSASMTGVNFSSWYNQSEGSLYVEADYNNTSTSQQYIVSLNSSTLSPLEYQGSFGLVFDPAYQAVSSSPGFINNFLPNGGTLKASGLVNKTCISMVTGSGKFSLNGGTVITGGSTKLSFTINQMFIGRLSTTYLNYLNGHIKKLTYYPKALTAVELQGLTS